MNADVSSAWDYETYMCQVGDTALSLLQGWTFNVITPLHLLSSPSLPPLSIHSPLWWCVSVCGCVRERDLKTNKDGTDLLGVRSRQVFFNHFSLPLPPPLTNYTSGLRQLMTFIFIPPPSLPSPPPPPHPLFTLISIPSSLYLLFHPCHLYFVYTPFLSLLLSWPCSPSDCYDCCAFLRRGLQEECVSTCQRAQVCSVDTGSLLEVEGSAHMHGWQIKAPQNSQVVTMQQTRRHNAVCGGDSPALVFVSLRKLHSWNWNALKW